MTVSSTVRKAGPFIGNDTTATFPFAFKVFSADDLEVVKADSAGIQFPLVLNSDFSASLNADQNSSPGGTVTLLAGNLPTGYTLIITSDVAALQETNLSNQGGFYPEVINNALDLLTILVQQLIETQKSAISFPVTENLTTQLPPAGSRAGKLLMFDAAGGIQLVPMAAGSGFVPGAQTCPDTVDGVNRDFTFVAAGATPTPIVFAGGIFQTPTTDYSTPVLVSGTTWKITFTTAPTSGRVTVLLLA